jgi:hypothetical protein
MSDLFTFDLEDGLAAGGCALCHAVSTYLRRWLESFWHEGWQHPTARTEFYASGGFCARHAWLPDDLDVRYAAAVADLYGHLAQRDLAALDDALASGGRRRGPARRLARPADCRACTEEAEATARKAEFFLALLENGTARERYQRGRGVCFAHLVTLVELPDDRVTRFLLTDWRRRLDALHGRLEHLDRTRDHRYASERTEDDERACADTIRQYVG